MSVPPHTDGFAIVLDAFGQKVGFTPHDGPSTDADEIERSLELLSSWYLYDDETRERKLPKEHVAKPSTGTPAHQICSSEASQSEITCVLAACLCGTL